jgi:hypothetical protein
MPDLEGPDEYITLRRAGTISGLTPIALRSQCLSGRLRTLRAQNRRFTTRRWLHAYLMSRKAASGRKPLPPDYVPPEG